MTKTCSNCGQTKPLDQFTKSVTLTQYKSKSPYHTYCKECNAIRQRDWRKTHKNYRGSGRVTNIPSEDRRLMSAIRQRIANAKGRCKKYNKAVPVITDTYLYELFLKQNRNCALTGAPLSIIIDDPLCLSLDQIEPDKGYIEGNVQWLAWCVNRAKGDLSLAQFFEMCEVVLDQKVQRLSNGANIANLVE